MTAKILAVAAVLAAGSLRAADDDVLVLSFFRDNGQAGVFLAASEDGVNFVPLNGDQPVMKPAPWPQQNLTRDPSIVYRNGKFHLVWTSNWKGRVFGYAESTDLLNWTEAVKVTPFPESLPDAEQPRNVWAPEIHWDEAKQEFAILWSSTTDKESNDGDGSTMNGKEGGHDHRIYVTRTKDGKTFTPAALFFEPGYCCIDAVLARTGDRWTMVFKDEREIALGGKNLKFAYTPDLATAPKVEGGPVAGPGSPLRPKEMAEGPSLFLWNGVWNLYWDAFANGHYSLATSPDLKTWTDRTAELKLPPHPRHGTVFRAPRAVVEKLKK